MSTQRAVKIVYHTAIVVYFIMWTLGVAVEVKDYLHRGGTEIWRPIVWQLSSTVVVLGILYLQRAALGNKVLLRTPRWWFWRLFRWLPLNCVVFVIVAFSIRHSVYALLGTNYIHEPWSEVLLYESIKLTIFFASFYVSLFGVHSYTIVLEERERVEQAQRLLQQAQIQRLTQQIQPHFLFNALNTISSLMYSNVKAADSALSQLSELLRGSLDLGEEVETTVEQELRLLRAYAALMQARFSDRVAFIWDVDEASLACKVPVMCLQAILENTFKHTVEQRSEMTRIAITARLTQAALELSVADDAGRLSHTVPLSGIGLANIRQRLAVMYGEGASLSIMDLPLAGVMTTIRLPIQILAP
ncbi:MAG: histidine kinase [Undibacterium sp.]|nr:histidine kinase [Undibacterium sp.]